MTQTIQPRRKLLFVPGTRPDRFEGARRRPGHGLGFPGRALERVEAGLAVSQRLAHANSLALAQNFAALLHSSRREFAAAQTRADATIDLAREHPLPQWLAEAIICRGFALVGLGQQAEGIAQLRTGLAAWNGTGCHLFDSQWLGFSSKRSSSGRSVPRRTHCAGSGGRTSAATGECHYQAELYRLRGAIFAETGERAEAASWFQEAIDTARRQQAKSLELRAATRLARLWAEQRGAEGLRPPRAGVRLVHRGLRYHRLKDAKALLDALS